jgi:hypothetical protein
MFALPRIRLVDAAKRGRCAPHRPLAVMPPMALAVAVGMALSTGRPVHAAEERGAALQGLERLAEGHAVVLGRARVVGEFNEDARRYGLHRTGPRSRDYSIKMVWAPDRATALFAGANHRVPHRLNDVWEFDLAAMAWKLLYAPDNPRSYRGLGDDPSDVEFRDGILVTRRGGPAVIGHTWWGLTYDPVHRRMLFMNWWLTKQDDAVRRLGGNPEDRFKGPPLWTFDPAARAWRFLPAPKPWPKAIPGAMLEFIPELEGAIWHMNNWQMRQTWLYRPQDNRWVDLRANATANDFAAQAPGRELVGYYDAGRRIVVAQWQRNTYHFDPLARRWSKVAAVAKDSDVAPYGHDARTAFYHDPASGHGLLVDFKEKEIWAYDPDATRWTRLQPKGDPMPRGGRMLSYVDPLRNALVVIDDTTVWAYRHRAARPATHR